MSSLPGLTLYRTMEDQKRQAEEDAKWLEQEDDEDEDDQDIDQIPSTSHSSVENIRTSNGYLHHTPTSTRSLRFEVSLWFFLGGKNYEKCSSIAAVFFFNFGCVQILIFFTIFFSFRNFYFSMFYQTEN